MNPEFTHGRPLGPEGPDNEAKRESLREFAGHHPVRSGSSILGGILAVTGAALLFVATIIDSTQWAMPGVAGMKLVVFLGHYPLISFGSMLEWWGPILLLLVAGILVLSSQRLKVVTGALVVGAAAVLLFHFAGRLAVMLAIPEFAGGGHRSVHAGMYLGFIGSGIALVGGLVALLTARVKT